MAKILKFSTEAKEALMRGVNVVNDAVSSTLGPRGNNVAFERPWGAPTVVHDGVTVAKEVDLVDKFENMGAQLVKEAASKTNDIAGDGTTTATILAQSIVSEALKNTAAGSNAMMLRRGIDKAVSAVITRLGLMAKDVKTEAEVEQIAMISAQDEQIGKMIAATVNKLGKDSVITVEENTTREITVDFKEGMEFDRGFVSPYFITETEEQEATVQNPYILITDKRISAMQEFLPFVEMFMKEPKKGPDLVIICEEMIGEPLATLIVNKIKGNIRVLVTTAPGYGDKRKALLEDIAIVTGGKFISQELGMKLESVTMEDLGQAARVTSSKDNTLIVDGKGDPAEVKARIASIKKSIEKSDITEFDREKLQERLAKLTSGIAIIRVGANSETEMKEKKERCIDAISATKAALDEGIIPGGETGLVRASEAIDKLEGLPREEEIGAAIIKRACEQPFRVLMSNSGFDPGQMLERLNHTKAPQGIDVIDGEVKDMIAAGIIDPVKVTKAALTNAASVANMVMVTNVLIVEEPKPAEPLKPLAVN